MRNSLTNAIKTCKQVVELFVTFFKPVPLKDKILDVPKSVKKMGSKLRIYGLIMTVISLAFSFLLKLTNLLITWKLILLGIICFMLYRGQQLLSTSLRNYEDSEREKFDLIYNDEIVYRGSQLIGAVSNKVFKYDSSDKIYKIMSNESVMNAIKGYLKGFWEVRYQHKFDILELTSVFVMLVVAIVTNTEINNWIFIPTIVIVTIAAFFSSAVKTLHRKTFYKNNRAFDDQQRIIENDLLRVPAIVDKDLDMRIGMFKKTIIVSNENAKNYHRKRNMSDLMFASVSTLAQYVIILLFFFGVSWDSISLDTIAQITAELAIVMTAINQISGFVRILVHHSETVQTIENEEENINLILEVYHAEMSKKAKSKEIDHISLAPFSVRYMEESENDKPFTLKSEKTINIDNGEVVILSGASGSGKSTFMKLITERIRVEKSTEIPATSRYMFYDEKLKFGSLSLYDELFCHEENPDLAKMQSILENLHLWSEISRNCYDVWIWMQQKKFENSLSNGQKQRLILAKMLYWLDESVDVMVLDECTSGLDDTTNEADSANAQQILKYIVEYSNRDKKRIVIISTHQNVDEFVESLKDKYKFKNLHFGKSGETNLVSEM